MSWQRYWRSLTYVTQWRMCDDSKWKDWSAYCDRGNAEDARDRMLRNFGYDRPMFEVRIAAWVFWERRWVAIEQEGT